MKIFLGLLAGVIFSFSGLLSLIFVGKILQQIEQKVDWLSGEIFQWILFIILYVACIGLTAFLLVLLMEYFQLHLNHFGWGIIIGIFLYIPFSKWLKLYSKQ